MKKSELYTEVNGVRDYGTMSVEELCDKAEGMGAKPQYLQLAREGDAETLAQFEQWREKHKLRLPDATAMQYAVAGDYVDVGRFVSGEPECMMAYDGYSPVRFTEVRLCMSRPWWTLQGEYFKYWSAALNMIDLLEAQGVRCRVVWEGNFRLTDLRGEPLATIAVVLKEHNEGVRMGQFAALMLNNQVFINLILEAMDLGDTYMADWRARYGENETLTPRPTEERIVIPSMYYFLEMVSQGRENDKWRMPKTWEKGYGACGAIYPKFTEAFLWEQWGVASLLGAELAGTGQ